MKAPDADSASHPVLKAHPRLFAVLCVIFVLWLAALLILYFKTVYPLRHPPAMQMSGSNASGR